MVSAFGGCTENFVPHSVSVPVLFTAEVPFCSIDGQHWVSRGRELDSLEPLEMLIASVVTACLSAYGVHGRLLDPFGIRQRLSKWPDVEERAVFCFIHLQIADSRAWLDVGIRFDLMIGDIMNQAGEYCAISFFGQAVHLRMISDNRQFPQLLGLFLVVKISLQIIGCFASRLSRNDVRYHLMNWKNSH